MTDALVPPPHPPPLSCLSPGVVRASSIFPILSAILLLLGGVCVAASRVYKSKRNIILGAGILFVAAGERQREGTAHLRARTCVCVCVCVRARARLQSHPAGALPGARSLPRLYPKLHRHPLGGGGVAFPPSSRGMSPAQTGVYRVILDSGSSDSKAGGPGDGRGGAWERWGLEAELRSRGSGGPSGEGEKVI